MAALKRCHSAIFDSVTSCWCAPEPACRPMGRDPPGRVAGGDSLRVRVTAVGEQTALSGIMRLVAEAQASQSRAQILADRAASLLFFVALAAGVVTLAAWIAW